MKQKRELRVSGYKDYIAVDIVDEQKKVLSTPFYLKKGEIKQVNYKDQEELRLYRTDVALSADFSKLICVDRDGMKWESEFDELLDTNLFQFLQP